MTDNRTEAERVAAMVDRESLAKAHDRLGRSIRAKQLRERDAADLNLEDQAALLALADLRTALTAALPSREAIARAIAVSFGWGPDVNGEDTDDWLSYTKQADAVLTLLTEREQ